MRQCKSCYFCWQVKKSKGILENREMLYQAVFVPDETEVLPRDIIEQPGLKNIFKTFDKSEILPRC